LYRGFAGELRIVQVVRKEVFCTEASQANCELYRLSGGGLVRRLRRRIANCTGCQEGVLYVGFAGELRIRTGCQEESSYKSFAGELRICTVVRKVFVRRLRSSQSRTLIRGVRKACRKSCTVFGSLTWCIGCCWVWSALVKLVCCVVGSLKDLGLLL